MFPFIFQEMYFFKLHVLILKTHYSVMKAFIFRTALSHPHFQVPSVKLGPQFIFQGSGLNIQNFEVCCLLKLGVIWSGSGN